MKKETFYSKCLPFLKGLLKLVFVTGVFYSGVVLGQSADIGSIATHITLSFSAIGKLILAIAFLGGIGFIMAAIFKFKQHKDNPTQIPLGTPIAMLIIGAFLVFMPSIVGPAGTTIFGSGTPGGFTGAGASVLPGAS